MKSTTQGIGLYFKIQNMIMEIEEKDGLAKANLKQCSKLDLYEAWKSSLYDTGKDVINLIEACSIAKGGKSFLLIRNFDRISAVQGF